ncbi:hypothetical protein ABPG74_019125 [Tetrahymena malaccensis]
MSIQDIEIEGTRQNQGEAMKSKDWEQVRNKKFIEEDFLWNDSQISIDESKQQKNTFQNIQILQNQLDTQRLDAQLDQSNPLQLGLQSQSKRRFQFISKYSTSRTKTKTKTIEIDVSNIIETSQINQTQDFMAQKEQKSVFQSNLPQTQKDQRKTNNRINSFVGQFSKIIVLITKLKLRLKNFYERVTKIQKPRALSNEIRQTINDPSDLIEEKETFLQSVQYYQNSFQEDQQNKQLVICKLSADLQESLKREQFKEIINQIDYLLNKNISLQVLQDLALYIEEEFYLPNQKLKLIDDQSLIFILQGELEIYNNQEHEKANKKNIKKLGVGKSFGLVNFITGIPSNHILKSSMFTNINADILDMLNITLSDSEGFLSDCNNSEVLEQNKQLSQKELEFPKISQNNISQKTENVYRKQSAFMINKQSFKDLDDQQKGGLDLNAVSMQDQSFEKVNLNGLESFVQNSLTLLNENQRVNFKEFDKNNKEGSENTKISEERIETVTVAAHNKKQIFQIANKSIKNISQKFLQRLSHLFENQDNISQKDNIKQEFNKLIENFQSLNQAIIQSNNKKKNSTHFQNQVQEETPKKSY